MNCACRDLFGIGEQFLRIVDGFYLSGMCRFATVLFWNPFVDNLMEHKVELYLETVQKKLTILINQ